MKTSPFALRAMAVACAVSCAPMFSFAQSTPELKPVVVTATRTATQADELISEVVVIDQAQIAQQSGRTLAEVLTRLGGLQFSSNGGLGKASNVYIRGTETRHTILLIDGVRYGSATLGTPIWDNLPLEAIERIEILKGPASSLYGSEAIGGVVQIFTRQGGKGITPRVGITLGSDTYRKLSAGVGGSAGDLSFNADLNRLTDKGFSATNPQVPFGNFNPDRDGFKQDSANVSLKYRVNKDWSVDAGVLYADGLNRLDQGPNQDTRAEVRSEVYRLGVNGKITPIWATSLRYGDSQDRSNNLEPASLFQTKQTQWTWQNDIDTPAGLVTAGWEQLKQKVDSTTNYTVKSRTVNSIFLGLNG
ncbi:MAG: TonB-dependent receptor plug domain-containing protein, partial [Brachymonas sp.]